MSKKTSKGNNTPGSTSKSRKPLGDSRKTFSPSPKKGTSGYDFCARVRKCCVSWHECVQKWDKTNSNGLELATKIVNAQLQRTSEGTEEPQREIFPPVLSSLTSDNDQLLQDKDELVQVFYTLKDIKEKMATLTSNFEAILSLHHLKGGESKKNEPIFETWPLENYVTFSGKLTEMFAKEVRLKERLVGMILKETKSEDRNKMMSCLAMWLHQPYLEDEYRQELELMLLETGLKTI